MAWLNPRRVGALCYFSATLIVGYWVAWFARRSLVATSTARPYVNFEQAFPVADALIVVFLVLGARALARRSPRALMYLVLAAGAGFYLGAMDVLYDLEHAVWFTGVNGVVELTINVATVAVASVLLGWAWRERRQLDPPSGECTARSSLVE